MEAASKDVGDLDDDDDGQYDEDEDGFEADQADYEF